ncbi:MAG: hypothetical protein F6J93_21095 [Oscillatoria sp. SIO1A7]|nr:hypothetical protein [Oscillatoria sp. SIO1A7]
MKWEALAVGINRYLLLKSLTTSAAKDLTIAHSDATKIANRLETSGGHLWNVRLLPAGEKDLLKKNELEAAIAELFPTDSNQAPEGALLFFAGHGFRAPCREEGAGYEGFLGTSDANPRGDNWGVSLTWLRQRLLQSKVKKQIVWLDCCHSGELLNFLTEDELKDWLSGGDRLLIAASRDDKTALGTREQGVLTKVLLDALDPELHPAGELISSYTIKRFIDQTLSSNPVLKGQIPLVKHFGEEILFWPGSKKTKRKVRQLWKLEYTLDAHSDRVSSVAISPDGKIIASSSHDRTVKLWNLTTGQLLKALAGHSSAVLSVAFSPDGKTLASASNMEFQDGNIKLWDVSTGRLSQTMNKFWFAGRVCCVVFSPSGQTLVSGNIDATIKFWDLGSGKQSKTLRGHGWDVASVAFSPDGQRLVSGGMDGAIMIWDWRNGTRLRTLNRPDDFFGSLVSWLDSSVGFVRSVAISRDGKTIASGGYKQPVMLWNIDTGKLLRVFAEHSGAVSAVAFSPDGETLATSGEDNTLKIWDFQQGDLLQTLEHIDSVTCLAYSPDGKILVTGSADKTLNIWRL